MPRKKTKEEFIEDAKSVHDDRYDYSLVEYDGNKTKVKIICKEHGIFEQTPTNHTNAAANCPKCSLVGISKHFKKTKEQFIEDVIKVHGNKYDYSLVDYINNKTKVKIICKMHGVFEQTPASHIGKIAGCSKCYGNIKSSKKQFIEDAKKVHDDKYDYSLVEYVNNHTKVKIICSEHGIFEQAPKPHIIGKHGCSICSYNETGKNRRKSLEQFIEDARKAHGDKFDYSLVEYINSYTNVKIICPDHGTFEQQPDNHLNTKHGCMKCWNENRPPWRGYINEEYFYNNPVEVNKYAILYVIEMKGSKEHFIKVGITKRTIKERYSCTGMGDKYFSKNIIHEIPLTLYNAWVLEQQILNELKDYQYFPNYKFNGQTECLKPKERVFEYIQKLIFKHVNQGEKHGKIFR